MGSYTDVKNLIISNIKANGQREITGPILQDVLLNMLENSSRVEEITYSDLKALRDEKKLTPSRLYRITDYVTTTVQANTKSAGHLFDVIVIALSESELLEQAWTIQHEGDYYFANSNLSAWKIWYCLDNDTARFAWADAENGKGVIYRMIDEWNNDIPYDFKNIQFYRKWDADKSLWSTIPDGNTGVPCYTFSSSGNASTSTFTDMSLIASNNVYSNVIGKYLSSNKQTLNNICFFGNNCDDNTFGHECYSNTFGDSCHHNTFGNDCGSNIFGNYCYGNTFGNSCNGNTFGNPCYNNTFGNDCYENTFGNDCYENTFGNICYRNTFRNYFRQNTFGNNCWYNTFGNYCYENTFGNYFRYNTFGNYFRYNTFGDYIQHSQFGNDVEYFSITNKQMTTEPSSDDVKSYVRWLIVENGVRFVNAYVTGSTSSSSQCQNVRICLGIQGVNSNNRKTFDITSCINSKLNNVYQPKNSQTTSV